MADLETASKAEIWQTYSPYPEPSHPQRKARHVDVEPIRVRHPTYQDDGCNTLLTFWSADNRGAHHETVRIACAIVADNALGGYLSNDRDGNDPVDEDPEATLRNKSYYFHAAQPNDGKVVDYSVVPTFAHWRIPSSIPSYWAEVSTFPQNPQRPGTDSHCRLTQCDYAVENAHLVPASEREWFDKNSMAVYTDSTAIDKMKHPSNTLRFRIDIHTIFDSKRFAIVPVNWRLVAYCLNAQPGSHVERLYHGVELQSLNNPPQLLFARFAYTVFENLRLFLDARVERKLRLRVENIWGTETCDSERCQQFSRTTASQGKSRSVSPKKRSRMQEMEETEISASDSSDEEDLRGRKRCRTDESILWPPSFSSGDTSSSSSSCLSDDQSVASPKEFLLACQPADRGGGVNHYASITGHI